MVEKPASAGTDGGGGDAGGVGVAAAGPVGKGPIKKIKNSLKAREDLRRNLREVVEDVAARSVQTTNMPHNQDIIHEVGQANKQSNISDNSFHESVHSEQLIFKRYETCSTEKNKYV